VEVDLPKHCHPPMKIQLVLPQKIRNFRWRFLGSTVQFLNEVLRRIRGAKAEVMLRFKKLHTEKVHNCTFHLWPCLNQGVSFVTWTGNVVFWGE
jgi:hypothetical protein